MLQVTLASVWARRRRLLGTSLAVVIGVAFLTGTLLLGDTISANFDRLFAQVSANTDVVVRNATSTSDEPDANRGLIDESLLGVVDGVDGVQHAEAQVVGYGTLLGRDGDAIGGNGPPRQAGSWITDPELNPYQLVAGRAPRTDREVVVNRGAAESGDLHLGDTTIVQTPDPIRVTIVGIATFGDADGFGQTTFTAFTLPAAQANVTHQPGRVSTILVKAAPGVGSNELRARISSVLPRGVQAITGSDLTDERLDQLSFLDILRTLLVVFAGIALVVATLTINNTFSITVAQRTRELALLRAVGASRRQVRGSVSLEALTVGVVASVVGVVAGFGVATGLKGVFDAFGGALPAGGLTVRPLAIAIGFIVGVLVAFVAAQLPSRRAAAIPPVAALRELDTEPRGGIGRRGPIGAAALVAGVAVGVVGAVGGGTVAAAVGAVLLVTGTLMVAPAVFMPVAQGFGAVLARVRGVSGRFAAQNARRNPRRSASTATALVVGIAVVSLITVLVASLKATVDDDVKSVFGADLVVNTEFFGGSQLSPRAVDDLPRVAGGRAGGRCRAGAGAARRGLDGDHRRRTPTPSPRWRRSGRRPVRSARSARVGSPSPRTSPTTRRGSLGRAVTATFNDGSTERVRVRAIYEENALLGDIVMPTDTWLEHTDQPTLRSAFVTLRPGVTTAGSAACARPHRHAVRR